MKAGLQGIVKGNFCGSEEQSTYKFNGVIVSCKNLAEEGKPNSLSIIPLWQGECVCVGFKGLRSPQSIKTPLIPPAFHRHFGGGELCRPLQKPWAKQDSLQTPCSNVSLLTDLLSPLKPQGKGLGGTSEMQPDEHSQCSEVSNSRFRLCHSHTC